MHNYVRVQPILRVTYIPVLVVSIPLSQIYDDHDDHTPDDNFGSPNFWPV
jgi:hypothetical protein